MPEASLTPFSYMKYHIDNVDVSKGPTYEKAKKFGQMLLDNCRSKLQAKRQVLNGGLGKEVVDSAPVYRDVALPTAPTTEITAKGDIVYTETSRQNVRKLESYVKGEPPVKTMANVRNGIRR